MKKCNTLLCLLAVLFCMTAFIMPACAFASDGASAEIPKDELSTGTGDAGTEKEASAPESPLTPKGNLTLVDDVEQKGDATGKEQSKQFLTVESKRGNTFYIVIDRNGDEENVYLMNLVDEADLMALIESDETEEEPPVCTCKEKCAPGEVDATCPVCVTNLTECTGKEPEPEEESEQEEAPAKKGGGAIGAAVILLLALAGGGAYYFLKVKGRDKPDTRGTTDLDDYPFDEDEDEMEFESADEESDGDAEREESDEPEDS